MADAGMDVFMFDNPSEFSAEEMKYCREIGSDILQVLTDHDIFERHFWVSETNPSGRIIKLVGKQGSVLQVTSAEMPDISRDEVLRRLHTGIGG